MAATGTLGRIEEFDDATDWDQYVERLQNFFLANDIDDAAKQRAVFLSVVGAATYKTLRNLITPEKPADKTFAELVAVLAKHYKPKPSEIMERFKFHSRSRKPGESVAAYVAELRALTEFCNFGASLEEMIRDRLVCGINDPSLQKRLLAEPDLSYAKAVELALNAETATQSVKELRGKQDGAAAPQPVHKANRVTPPSRQNGDSAPTCYRCGNRGHTVAKCRVPRDVICHKCNKRGHLQRACNGSGKSDSNKRKPRGVSHVQDEEEEEEEEEQDSESGTDGRSRKPKTLHHLKSKGAPNSPPIIVKVRVDDCLPSMEVDTGAAHSLISEKTFQSLWPGRSLSPTDIRLQSYSKAPIPVKGCCYVNVEYEGQTGKMPLLRVGGCGPTLLGRDWLSQIQLNWRQINHVHSASLQSVLSRYPSVFKEGLGTLQGFQARIHVDPQATPQFHPARSVPYALREKVDQELQRLERDGTIEPVDIAEWAAPIVVVLKQDKQSVRICGDFSVTINPVSKLDRYPIPRVEDLFARLSGGTHFSKLDLSHAYQQLPLDEDSRRYVVINTHRGLFRFTRLPFGISSSLEFSSMLLRAYSKALME